VIIQTLNPGHYALASAQKHDYLGFFESEIALRRELGYPPFARLALIRLSGKAEARVSEAAEAVAQEGRKLLEGFPAEEMEILGPAPSPTARLRERYRYQIMLRSVTAKERHRTLKAWLPAARKIIPKEVAFSVDVDPYHLL
jgi:primosomal protein N' (replication factor Y)